MKGHSPHKYSRGVPRAGKQVILGKQPRIHLKDSEIYADVSRTRVEGPEVKVERGMKRIRG